MARGVVSGRSKAWCSRRTAAAGSQQTTVRRMVKRVRTHGERPATCQRDDFEGRTVTVSERVGDNGERGQSMGPMHDQRESSTHGR